MALGRRRGLLIEPIAVLPIPPAAVVSYFLSGTKSGSHKRDRFPIGSMICRPDWAQPREAMNNQPLVSVVGLISLILCILMVPTTAWAQDQEDPLRLAYVNTSGSEGRDSYQAVRELLRGSDQIELIRERTFMRSAQEVGIDEDTLADWGRWPELVDHFGAAMWRSNVEGLLIHRVEEQGAELYSPVFGPRGWELTEVERPLADGGLSDEATMEVLREAFTALVPEVRGFRREVREGRVREEDFAIARDSDDGESSDGRVAGDDSLSPRERALAEHRRRYGDLSRNVAIYVGGLTGRRSMSMNQPEGTFKIDHRTALMGVGLRADALITTVERDTAAFEVSGFAGFSPFSTVFGERQLSGQYMRFGAEGRYINARSATTRLRVILGVETINISLEGNEFYTGHGYLMGRAGGGIEHSIGQLMTLKADGLIVPVVTSSNSGGAYGSAEGFLGFGADASMELNLFEPLLVGLFYSFVYLDQDYPEPTVIAMPAESTDMVHQVMIGLGYRF